MGATGLPIEDCIPALRDALATRGTAVLQAEPGAGKSTVVPLRLLGEAWLDSARIVMLEPRRLAARATARRMAFLLGEEVGATVGYRTRDESKVGRSTRIEVVTEGILTRRLQRDPTLPGIGLVIFDEVHERNLQSDLALALTLDVRRVLRPELAVLTMSATLDVDRVAALLADEAGNRAPIVSGTGRSHPVDVRWTPHGPRQRVAEATAAAVRTALRDDPGDVLVFLAGAADIRRVASLLEGGSIPSDVDVRPLFGGLSADEQDVALAASAQSRRRVVLSTDIAETSLTVEGVRVVIDAGEVRRPEFDHRSGLTRLRTGATSQASADQRSGRAGRTEPGVAYRLWSAAEHGQRKLFAEPEIRTADVVGLALELAMWGATADELAFLDPPPAARLDDALELLRRLGAIDGAGRPTDAGRAMAELPLHPRLSHMVTHARSLGNGWLACLLAALLEDRDVLRGHPSELPIDVEERVRLVADQRHRHVSADRGAVATARRRAAELARRADVTRTELDLDACGSVLALAYPDRIAQAQDGGRFRLRSGQTVSTPAGDPLATVDFLVVADVGPGYGADVGVDQVRLAAALTRDELEAAVGADIATSTRLTWNAERDELQALRERRLGAIVLASTTGRATPGDDATRALVDRVRERGLVALTWPTAARALQDRIGFARRAMGEPWPEVADEALLDHIDEWLTPLLIGGTRRSDIEHVDVTTLLRARLGHRLVPELDRVVPATVTLPSGRAIRVDYDTDPPSIAVRAQEMFGPSPHPTICEGRLPLAVHLLSPAGRVVQVTSDLPGFWRGSWTEVRKELAGRYPKHAWPAQPWLSESEGSRHRRR